MSLFSVVICTYNRAALVGNAVESVLRQSFEDFELIVVDDGSSDDTVDVLSRYEDPRLVVVSRENGGLSAARNTGIAKASGRFVAFLDDDDEVLPQWLSGLASRLDESTGLVSCTCTEVNENRSSSEVLPATAHNVYDDVFGVFVAGTFAVDRQLLVDVGGYAEEIRVSHQSELLLRVLPLMKERGMTSALVDEPLVEIERREARDRPLSQPADLLDGAEYLIEHHGELLQAGKPTLADYFAIAGVSAAQLGDHRRARRHLRQAFLTHPIDPKHLLRFLASLVPPVARRTWRHPS